MTSPETPGERTTVFPPAAGRDYVGAMHALIERTLPDGDWRSIGIAHQVVDHCMNHDPELLAGFLWERRHQILRELITRRCDQDRGRLRAQGRIQAFNDAARAAVDHGDPDLTPSASSRYGVFTKCFIVTDDNLRRPIGDMTPDDNLYVATQYERTVRQAERDRAFFQRMAKEIKNRHGQVVRDVFTEEEWLRVYQGVTGREIPDAR